MTPGLENEVVDQDAHKRNVEQLNKLGLKLPRIADLANPPARLAETAMEIADADPDTPDQRNLFRVHWHNGPDRRSMVDVPGHIGREPP